MIVKFAAATQQQLAARALSHSGARAENEIILLIVAVCAYTQETAQPSFYPCIY
jgi:hypothetical protein